MSETATYPPDATACAYGHPFESEADCVLPEDWDRFMCRRCLVGAGLSTNLAAWDYAAPTATPDDHVRTPTRASGVRTIAAGKVYFGPVGASFAEMTLLGRHFGDPPAASINDVFDPFGPDRLRTGLPGDERCGAMGVVEKVDGDRLLRHAFPCMLDPGHGGDEHKGAAGAWLNEGDPRGVKTVWPGPAPVAQTD